MVVAAGVQSSFAGPVFAVVPLMLPVPGAPAELLESTSQLWVLHYCGVWGHLGGEGSAQLMHSDSCSGDVQSLCIYIAAPRAGFASLGGISPLLLLLRS